MTTEDDYSLPVIGAVSGSGPLTATAPDRPDPTAKHVADLLRMAAQAVKAAADNHRQLRGFLPPELYEPVRLAYEDITDYGAQLLNRELRRRSGEIVHGTRFEDWHDVFAPDVPELTAIYEETDR